MFHPDSDTMKCYNKGTTHARWRIYTTQLYSPHHVRGATTDLMLHNELERANHYALRTILNLGISVTYDVCLSIASMSSLEQRRIEQSLIVFFFKVLGCTALVIFRISLCLGLLTTTYGVVELTFYNHLIIMFLGTLVFL